MSAQVYLARLMNEGRAHRAPHAAALQAEGLVVRPERRRRRARGHRRG